ncbi:MAG: site-specific integrase, partial [Chitinophagaceae bacterium]
MKISAPLIIDVGVGLELPEVAKTRDGVEFNPRQSRWSYREALMTVSIDFGSTVATSAPELLAPSKLALLWYAKNKSANHLRNMHERLSKFLEFRAACIETPNQITVNDVLNYKASLELPRRWYLTSLAGFLKKWHRLGYPGVSEDVVRLLDSLTLSGNQKGAAVLTMDPILGPFSDIEVEALQDAMNEGYSNDELEENEYFLARLFLALGGRPEQYASLKACDVRQESTEQGDHAYFLNLPRAKHRGQCSRTEFKSRALIPQIGAPLLDYANRLRGKFVALLDDSSQAPLFPQKRETSWAEGFEFHQTSKSLGILLKNSLSRLGVMSERTGEELNIAPIRFRRTLGTRAAQEGHGELVIAELLDHSDTQNAGVYVAATPEIAQRIDRAVAMTMAPLAQAFKGVVIDDESQATRRCNDPAVSAQLKLLKHKPQQGFAYPAPG